MLGYEIIHGLCFSMSIELLLTKVKLYLVNLVPKYLVLSVNIKIYQHMNYESFDSHFCKNSIFNEFLVFKCTGSIL